MTDPAFRAALERHLWIARPASLDLGINLNKFLVEIRADEELGPVYDLIGGRRGGPTRGKNRAAERALACTPFRYAISKPYPTEVEGYLGPGETCLRIEYRDRFAVDHPRTESTFGVFHTAHDARVAALAISSWGADKLFRTGKLGGFDPKWDPADKIADVVGRYGGRSA